MTLRRTLEGGTRQSQVGDRGGLSGSELGMDEQVVSVTQESRSADVRLNPLQGEKPPG